jgi:nitroreductase
MEAVMELLEAIYQRRAVRSFKKLPVAEDMLQELIDAAIQAPSAVNAQPWVFTVIRNAALLDKISTASKQHMLTALGGTSAMHGFREYLGNPDFHIFYHAPVLVLISVHGRDWAVEDAALAAQNLMLTAHDQGLGSCWIGFAQRWLATEEGRRFIDLPSDCLPVAPIIVGHPDSVTPPVTRKAPVIRWMD